MNLSASMRTSARRLAELAPGSRTTRVVLAALAVGLYALTFHALYELYGTESLYLAAALVLTLAGLLGFWAGLAAGLASLPLNAALLGLLGEPGWVLVTRPGSLQAAVLVLVLGTVLGGLRDIGAQLRHEMEERRRAEQARRDLEERYRIVVEGAMEAIFTLAEDGRIRYANPAAQRIFGYAAVELVDRPFERLIAEPARHRGVPGTAAAPAEPSSGGRRIVELPGLHHDGRRIPLEASFGAFRHEDERGFIGIVRDVTERKQAEQAMLAAKAAAEQANSAKSEFLSRMSHELRTPLNAVLGFGQLLQMDGLEAEQTESVEQILKAGRHLLDLINEVLDIARIEAGRLPLSLEPTCVAEVIAESAELVRPLAQQRRLVVVAEPMDPEAHVIADRQRLKQVLLNLLSNAVKYNREGGRVTLSVVERDGLLELAVADTGLGIPPDRLERLFTPFERLDADRTGVEGTGLGLALSKRLVEAMGGTLSVRSRVGAGSTFVTALPRGEDPVARYEREGEPALDRSELRLEPGPAARVLYIEDNISNFRLIERVLAHRPGVELLAAMQGQLGLELAAEHRPDIILLDLDLPDMHGSEVLATLRTHPTLREIPVIVISADATPGQSQRLLGAGAREYLTKPLDVPLFLKVLDATLMTARACR